MISSLCRFEDWLYHDKDGVLVFFATLRHDFGPFKEGDSFYAIKLDPRYTPTLEFFNSEEDHEDHKASYTCEIRLEHVCKVETD